MNKISNSILMALLPGILIGCSEERFSDVDASDCIRFDAPFTQKTVSRALGDIDNDNFTSSHFKVWSKVKKGNATQTVFDGTEVYFNGGSWTYENPQKWEGDDFTYSFAALAPAENIPSGKYKWENDLFTILDVPLSTRADEGIDYLVSDRVETSYRESGGTVQLNFKHILSRLKVNIMYSSDDAELEGVTLKSVKISLPIGSAKYSQVLVSGPSESDVWSWSNTSTLSYTLLDSESEANNGSYKQLGNGFFVAPTPSDISVTMDLEYDVNLWIDGQLETIPVTKENFEITSLTNFKQGYISNLWLNIKPTGNDYAYIEMNVTQNVAEHEDSNGTIDENGRAFIIKDMWQADNLLYTEIDAMGNAIADKPYRLISVTENGDEKLDATNTFSLVSVDGECCVVSTPINAFLDANVTYDFVMSDLIGNEASAQYTLTEDLGGASMAWTVTVSNSYSDFAIPFPDSGKSEITYRIDWGDGKAVVEIPKGTARSSEDAFYHKYSTGGTYQITITSAIGDPTMQQIERFSFFNYRKDVNTYPDDKLISLDTPLLNLGENADEAFKECKALSSIPVDLFVNNESLVTMSGFFNKTTLTDIPAGLFDPLVNVEDMSNLFSYCTSLVSVPEGLFAKNLRAYKFRACFNECNNLSLNAYIFINNDSEKATRFASVEQPVDLTRVFYGCSKLSGSNKNSVVPDLWNYAYPAGFTWENTGQHNPMYSIDTGIQNYSDIPSLWISGEVDSSILPGYIDYPY